MSRVGGELGVMSLEEVEAVSREEAQAVSRVGGEVGAVSWEEVQAVSRREDVEAVSRREEVEAVSRVSGEVGAVTGGGASYEPGGRGGGGCDRRRCKL